IREPPIVDLPSVSSGISLFIVVTRSTGSDINFMANAPMPPDAILLPRWGVQMKTTRLMRGLALKVVAFATRSVGRSVAKSCMPGSPSVCSQSARVMLVTCACESKSPHTVADQDIVFVIRIKLIYFGQFFAQT